MKKNMVLFLSHTEENHLFFMKTNNLLTVVIVFKTLLYISNT